MLKVSVRAAEPIKIKVGGGAAASVAVPPTRVVVAGLPDEYPGPYEITPGDEAQILQASGMMMPQDIIVKPIPSNYGKITWDGASLTVS